MQRLKAWRERRRLARWRRMGIPDHIRREAEEKKGERNPPNFYCGPTTEKGAGE